MIAVGAAGLALAACGGGEEDEPERAGPPARATSTATATPVTTPTPNGSPTATAPSAPSPPPDAPEDQEGGAGDEGASPESPEEQEGGAGDEEAARVPLRFTIDGEGITPPQVEAPAFLGLELIVRNDTPREQIVSIDGTDNLYPLRIEPGTTARKRFTGLRGGRYRVDAGQAGEATLVIGGEPGP